MHDHEHALSHDPMRQVNEIRGTVLGDGTLRLQTGEFSQANHRSADELVKWMEDQLSANPVRTKAKGVKQKHQQQQRIRAGGA